MWQHGIESHFSNTNKCNTQPQLFGPLLTNCLHYPNSSRVHQLLWKKGESIIKPPLLIQTLCLLKKIVCLPHGSDNRCSSLIENCLSHKQRVRKQRF